MAADQPVLDSLRKAVEAMPDDVPLRVHLATMLFSAGLRDEAIRQAGAALQRDPGNAGALALVQQAGPVNGPGPGSGPALSPGQPGGDFDWSQAESQQLSKCQIAWSSSFQAKVLRTAEAELIPLWVGQDEPVLATLADVHLSRAKGEQPVELGRMIAVDGFDVQVQPVLGELRPVRHEPEVDLERATVDPDRHAVATAVNDLPA